MTSPNWCSHHDSRKVMNNAKIEIETKLGIPLVTSKNYKDLTKV